MIPGLGQGKDEMSLELLTAPASKEVLFKRQWGTKKYQWLAGIILSSKRNDIVLDCNTQNEIHIHELILIHIYN